MTSAKRHRWGEPVRFERKTERECLNGCGTIKVTRHENEGGFDRHWVEFWRDQEKIPGKGTPACEPVMEVADG
jgi:hypothetical protein